MNPANERANTQEDILQLAEAAGIATIWSDAYGLPRQVSPPALAAIFGGAWATVRQRCPMPR
ncbi:hypothetical protein ACFS07_31155 [Undibacterium arcticum]